MSCAISGCRFCGTGCRTTERRSGWNPALMPDCRSAISCLRALRRKRNSAMLPHAYSPPIEKTASNPTTIPPRYNIVMSGSQIKYPINVSTPTMIAALESPGRVIVSREDSRSCSRCTGTDKGVKYCIGTCMTIEHEKRNIIFKKDL